MTAPVRSTHPSRREAIRAATAFAIAPIGVAASDPPREAVSPRPILEAVPPPPRTFEIEAATVDPFGVPTPAITVGGTIPGPEVRVTQGELFRTRLVNRLDTATTVHWHGLIVPNYMDGVPNVTQLPLGPGELVDIEFPLRQSGSYWYHSHVGFQAQQGLHGAFIIEERHPRHEVDHDVVVLMSDWLNQSPDGIIPQLRGEQPATAAVESDPAKGWRYPGDRPYAVDVVPAGITINGRSNASPWSLRVRRGDRVRLRLINGSGSCTFRVGLDDAPMKVIAADGQDVAPVEVGSLAIATAERYDVIVEVDRDGPLILDVAALGTIHRVSGILHTSPSVPAIKRSPPAFRDPVLGVGNYAPLRAAEPNTIPDGPIRPLEVVLGGDMKTYRWSLNGEYYPTKFVPDGHAAPLEIQAGERVRISFRNPTMMFHPMHLHGHSFRVLPRLGAWDDRLAPIKDTVAVPPKGRVDIEFFADNPGRWFFHCHNMFHAEAGMIRQVHYTT